MTRICTWAHGSTHTTKSNIIIEGLSNQYRREEDNITIQIKVTIIIIIITSMI